MVARQHTGRDSCRAQRCTSRWSEVGKALVPVTTYELAKEDFAPVLETRPEVAHERSRALARRQAAGQLVSSANIDKTVPPRRLAARFSDRRHRPFDLADIE